MDQWKNKLIDNRDAYCKLYNYIIDFNKHIISIYDRITGSNYIFIIAAQLYNGVISEEDMKELSEDAKQSIKLIVNISSNENIT